MGTRTFVVQPAARAAIKIRASEVRIQNGSYVFFREEQGKDLTIVAAFPVEAVHGFYEEGIEVPSTLSKT